MKRSPLRRRTPLKSKGRKATRETPAQDAFRAAVRDRARGMCEAHTPACPMGQHQGHHAHHLCIADRRVGRHEPERGLFVCGLGHGWIHANPQESYARGLLIRGAA